MDELEALRRKRLSQLRRQQEQAMAQQAQEEAQLQSQIEQLEAVVRQVLTKDALARYGNIKAAHPEKAIQVLVVLGQLIQQRGMTSINDDQLKQILNQLQPEKKDFKIRRI